MRCRDFEQLFERLVEGRLEAAEADRCAAHAAACDACGELLALAGLEAPSALPDGFVREVVGRTAGSACAAAHEALCAWVDGELAGDEAALVARHAADCPDCRGLAGAVAALRRDLPRLAVLRPDERFVADVLRRTLPVSVQLRRWWRATWPRWVHRPRFASEAAFIGLLVLVLVFSTPGSPLEAVPHKALVMAQEPAVEPKELLGAPIKALEERAATVAETVRESEEARAVAQGVESVVATGQRLRDLAGEARETLGTLWRQAASLLEKGGNEPATETEDPIEETS